MRRGEGIVGWGLPDPAEHCRVAAVTFHGSLIVWSPPPIPAYRAVPAPSPHPMPIRVLASVITRDSRFLICKRPAHKRHGSLWEFPGGKVEAGETDLEAANRELKEELGVTVRKVGRTLFSVQDPGSEFVIEFLPVRIEGEPACLEHDELAWVSPGQLEDYALAPSDREFARRYLVGLHTGAQ